MAHARTRRTRPHPDLLHAWRRLRGRRARRCVRQASSAASGAAGMPRAACAPCQCPRASAETSLSCPARQAWLRARPAGAGGCSSTSTCLRCASRLPCAAAALRRSYRSARCANGRARRLRRAAPPPPCRCSGLQSHAHKAPSSATAAGPTRSSSERERRRRLRKWRAAAAAGWLVSAVWQTSKIDWNGLPMAATLSLLRGALAQQQPPVCVRAVCPCVCACQQVHLAGCKGAQALPSIQSKLGSLQQQPPARAANVAAYCIPSIQQATGYYRGVVRTFHAMPRQQDMMMRMATAISICGLASSACSGAAVCNAQPPPPRPPRQRHVLCTQAASLTCVQVLQERHGGHDALADQDAAAAW